MLAQRVTRFVLFRSVCAKADGDAQTYLHEIREVEICVYEATIASPVVCDFSQYPVLTGGPQAYVPQMQEVGWLGTLTPG